MHPGPHQSMCVQPCPEPRPSRPVGPPPPSPPSSFLQINAGVRQHDMKYSHFIHGMTVADVQLNRKVLADLAVFEPYSFQAVVETVRLAAASSKEELA